MDEWNLYVHLHSTRWTRLWNDEWAPQLSVSPQPGPPKCRQCVLEMAAGILEENGIKADQRYGYRQGHNHGDGTKRL